MVLTSVYCAFIEAYSNSKCVGALIIRPEAVPRLELETALQDGTVQMRCEV